MALYKLIVQLTRDLDCTLGLNGKMRDILKNLPHVDLNQSLWDLLIYIWFDGQETHLYLSGLFHLLCPAASHRLRPSSDKGEETSLKAPIILPLLDQGCNLI